MLVTHTTWLRLAPSSVCRSGVATATMVWSRRIMKNPMHNARSARQACRSVIGGFLLGCGVDDAEGLLVIGKEYTTLGFS